MKFNLSKLETIITWTAPALFIPSLRVFNDPPKERKKLFVRDFTTYSIGTTLFFVSKSIAYNLLNKVIKNEGKKNFASFMVAITSNIMYAGVGAVKLSQFIDKKYSIRNEQQKNNPLNINSTITKNNTVNRNKQNVSFNHFNNFTHYGRFKL